jgi:hypothetical protein
VPTVNRVRFPNINEVEVDVVFVGLVDFVYALGMFTKRRSRIGPEDQRNRFASALRELAYFVCSFAI